MNTDGSDFDTVLAVYTGDGTGFNTVEEEACDNDGGLDGEDSSLHFTAVPGHDLFHCRGRRERGYGSPGAAVQSSDPGGVDSASGLT